MSSGRYVKVPPVSAVDPDEIREVVERWRLAIEQRDVATSDALRDAAYVLALADGSTLTKADELRRIGEEGAAPALSVGEITVAGAHDEATATFDAVFEDGPAGGRTRTAFRQTLVLQRTGGVWRVVRAEAESEDAEVVPSSAAGRALRRLPAPVQRAVRSTRARARNHGRATTDLYLPHRPGRDYAMVPPDAAALAAGGLPLPPRELWEGYTGYETGGALDVEQMLDVLREGGVVPEDAGRILDLGCAAGRMIRHLEPLAARCEIWGADINASAIAWCQSHLSPPFHFVTTTTVPHLPFADATFGLVYCGSLFTHIDELASAWLLELARLLRPGGALWVTIHDEYTVEQFEQRRWVAAPAPALLDSAVYREHGNRFDVLSVGRGVDAQVFYARDFFVRMAQPAFELVSASPGAYSCQTALLFRRTDRP